MIDKYLGEDSKKYIEDIMNTYKFNQEEVDKIRNEYRDQDEVDDMIDERVDEEIDAFKRELLSKILKLNTEELSDFIKQYEP